MPPAIRVEGLSKMYRIGTRPQAYHTLRETLSDAGVAAWRRIRQAASRAFGPWRNGRRLCPGAADEAVAGSAEATHGNGDCADVSPRLEGDHFWALKDVSFEVQPGEVVGIIGRNGAGKSTLLKILSRITEPTAGRVELRGRVGSLLEVGTGFHPELTGRENIYLNGSILGMSRREIQRKFDEIVAFAEIEDFLDTPVKRYSSGMYVRLAFAVAAHLEPEILIVDEVLAVGDAAFQQKCLGKMQTIAGHGRTVLFVSHNTAAVQRLCTKTMLIKAGRLVFEGCTAEALQRYAQETTALGSSDLSLRSDRGGDGRLRVRAIRVEGLEDDGTPGPVLPGRPARFVFELDRPIGAAFIAFTISDAAGAPLVAFNTRRSSPHDRIDPASTFVVCEIPHLYLLPGQYSLAIALQLGADLTDWLDPACSFAVENVVVADRFYVNPGSLPARVFLPHRWITPWCSRN